MPRAKLISQSLYPYHVSGRTINREWFSIPMEVVWDIMSNQLFFIHHAYKVKIHAFVLMSNHFHLILSTPEANINQAMCWFMKETSRELTRSGNRINQSYGGRYFRSVLKTQHYYLHAYKYLYANPNQAGLVTCAEDYYFSSLAGLMGRRKIIFPVEEDLTLFSDVTGTLNWINRPVEKKYWEDVRKAIRRKEFQFTRRNKQRHFLEDNAL